LVWPLGEKSSTLREAQRATLNTTDALAFDAGATYVPPVQGEA
jgi:hypothetical protein